MIAAALVEGQRDLLRTRAVQYLVHEAGAVAVDGAQTCRRCGAALLSPAPAGANRALWGYALGRRIGVLPSSGRLYLLSPDRQLAPDEVLCS